MLGKWLKMYVLTIVWLTDLQAKETTVLREKCKGQYALHDMYGQFHKNNREGNSKWVSVKKHLFILLFAITKYL